MSRSIEERLVKLETCMAAQKPSRRIHTVAAPTRDEGNAAIAKLIAEGASPDDLFIRLVPGEPDPNSHMYENHRWEGRWMPEDGREDTAKDRKC
jgi:hypothetical protein